MSNEKMWTQQLLFQLHLVQKLQYNMDMITFVTLELSLKSLKNSCFGREFRLAFDIF